MRTITLSTNSCVTDNSFISVPNSSTGLMLPYITEGGITLKLVRGVLSRATFPLGGKLTISLYMVGLDMMDHSATSDPTAWDKIHEASFEVEDKAKDMYLRPYIAPLDIVVDAPSYIVGVATITNGVEANEISIQVDYV